VLPRTPFEGAAVKTRWVFGILFSELAINQSLILGRVRKQLALIIGVRRHSETTADIRIVTARTRTPEQPADVCRNSTGSARDYETVTTRS